MEAAWQARAKAMPTPVEVGAGGDWRTKTPSAPYQRDMLSQEPFCERIIAMTREFEILTPDRDFCLNVRIVQRPERIEQFVAVLHDYCLTHHLIEK